MEFSTIYRLTEPNINIFENRLDKFWDTQELKYNDFKSQITGSEINVRKTPFNVESGEEEFIS